ncbi:transcription factor [Schizosaccharomyces japonicus yFS275]|uniref:Transcription factor n=1 Tax=Schizosaccharomyces japonicus (strain yFS275 / FY16936) TaxID=402676 RepID=B6JX01_SCHJY|nr:transcription factor [Schizosaccharomyces japonicus yFS275]EEB05902.2 transcription factor [Schizosaccharomyces japonicus yFS275]
MYPTSYGLAPPRDGADAAGGQRQQQQQQQARAMGPVGLAHPAAQGAHSGPQGPPVASTSPRSTALAAATSLAPTPPSSTALHHHQHQHHLGAHTTAAVNLLRTSSGNVSGVSPILNHSILASPRNSFSHPNTLPPPLPMAQPLQHAASLGGSSPPAASLQQQQQQHSQHSQQQASFSTGAVSLPGLPTHPQLTAQRSSPFPPSTLLPPRLSPSSSAAAAPPPGVPGPALPLPLLSSPSAYAPSPHSAAPPGAPPHSGTPTPAPHGAGPTFQLPRFLSATPMPTTNGMLPIPETTAGLAPPPSVLGFPPLQGPPVHAADGTPLSMSSVQQPGAASAASSAAAAVASSPSLHPVPVMTAPPQPKRQARKRTKTGCLTCRKRRIKCDEKKPVCYNCIKSKRQCEGYTHVLRSSGVVDATRKIPISSLLSEPAPHGMAGHPTHPTFLYYMQSVAPSLCLWDFSYFPVGSPDASFSSIYWSSTVPELALRNSTIGVALYAFASAKRRLPADAVAFARQARVTLDKITTTESLLVLVLLAVTQLYLPDPDVEVFNFAVDQVLWFDAAGLTSSSDELITYLLRRMFIRQVVLAGIVMPLANGMNPLPLLNCELPPPVSTTAVLADSLFSMGLRSLCMDPTFDKNSFFDWSSRCPVDPTDLARLSLLMIHSVFVAPDSISRWVEIILQHPDPSPAIHIARACLLAVKQSTDLAELRLKVEQCVQSCEARQLQLNLSSFSQNGYSGAPAPPSTGPTSNGDANNSSSATGDNGGNAAGNSGSSTVAAIGCQ